MDKSWLIIIPLVLLMVLLIPSMIVPNENNPPESTVGTEQAELCNTMESIDETRIEDFTDGTDPEVTTEPDETADQTENIGFIDGNAGCGEVLAFQDRYTIVKPPISDYRRIDVIVDGVLGHEDILYEYNDCSVDIQTADGVHVHRLNGMFYIPESDTVVRKVSGTYVAGDEAVKYHMYDGDYVFTLNLELIDITVAYVNQKYANATRFEKVLFYDLENVTSVRLEVSNYNSQEVRCFVIGPEGETEVFPSELPEDVRGLYGDADQ